MSRTLVAILAAFALGAAPQVHADPDYFDCVPGLPNYCAWLTAGHLIALIGALAMAPAILKGQGRS